ncbi:uncharacterized protein LOC133518594 [Cydia pomonella]|uniref:uncharacterized protein LOC133518594 n=1 Tax=Cydia pomonella TaxID=82600 RepID=UPI002ADE79C5|nr:uncharacterized protein LOC133518594 [Cydia pomonella]
MKRLVVLSALVALCAGTAIPLVPGDNSHYVEGESRYIWMPDGDGNPHLVDLQEPVDEAFLRNKNGANNQYWLYTRWNPTNPQVIVNGNANTIWSSNYVASRPLKVIVHGWNSDGNSAINPLIRDAFLAISDANVIVVDWRALANGLYATAAAGVPNVGQHLGNFLVWLINTAGGNWNNVHLVGFSLGAHVVANAGRTAGGRPVRVTGLDPAGPLWSGNSNAISGNAGIYVECIHTDGGLLGIFNPSGNADFYPNGGRNPQPGCWISTCSHSRAYELFASTVRHNHLNGRLCGNINQAQNNQCSGGTFQMGNGVLSKQGYIGVGKVRWQAHFAPFTYALRILHFNTGVAMKLLVVFISAVAWCASASNEILTPGDNSHYVDGESRYIWMPDGDGKNHLVDLQEPVDYALLNSRNGANNAYWLYTRWNPNNPQVIIHGNANSLWSSNYVASRPLKVIVHGWNGSGNSGLNGVITSAFLAVEDANVIVVDWRTLAGSNYITAVAGVPSVGQALGDFVVWLRNTGGGVWTNVHLVGFSLGAHIVGVAGRQAGGRPARVTGLDPAGPLWQTNSNAINSNSGVYVEGIHTDGYILGIFNPIGDADFYPNGGRSVQPGCPDSSCSHERAHSLFASSVYFNHFVGRLCGNLNQAQNNQCTGAQFNMGNSNVNKRGSGIYGLTTGSSWPY